MKNIKQFIRQHRILFSSIAILFFVFSLFSISQIISHNNQQKNSKYVLAAKIQSTPTSTVTPTLESIALGSQTEIIKQTPTSALKSTPSVTPAQSPQNNLQSNNAQPQTLANSTQTQPPSTPMPTEATAQSTPTPSPTQQPTTVPAQTVNIQITDPDGTKSFQVTFHNGDNLCDNLTEAKNEGKIKSLTLDNSYMSAYHSLYVREIDSYSNNWTVTDNGTEPQGCSLFNPKPNDNILWKFL